MDRGDATALGQVQKLAQKLRTARTARERYEISREMNNASKHAQADVVDIGALGTWRDLERWEQSNVRGTYDRKMDILYLYAPPLDPAMCIYAKLNDFLVLVSRETHEIVGYQIDNFTSVWLKAHPEIQAQARVAARPLAHPLLRRFSGAWTEFTKTVATSLTRASQNIPTSARMC